MNMNNGAYVRVKTDGEFIGWGMEKSTLDGVISCYESKKEFKVFDSIDALIHSVLSNRTGFKVGDMVKEKDGNRIVGKIRSLYFGNLVFFDCSANPKKTPYAVLEHGAICELDYLAKYTKPKFKVGDKVKVVRRVDVEEGWDDNWIEGMNGAIGNIYEVNDTHEYMGIKIKHDGFYYNFPPSSLELVTEPEKVSIEDMVNYLDTVHDDYIQAIIDDYHEAKEKEQKQKRLTELKQKYHNIDSVEYTEYQTLLKTLGE